MFTYNNSHLHSVDLQYSIPYAAIKYLELQTRKVNKGGAELYIHLGEDWRISFEYEDAEQAKAAVEDFKKWGMKWS